MPEQRAGTGGRNVTLDYLTLRKTSEMEAIWEIQTFPLPHTLEEQPIL